MKIEALQIGDIIFVRKGPYDYIHIGICTRTGGTIQTTLMAHVLGKMEPYALVETHLAPREILDKNDIHYDVVRPKKHTKINDGINIIKAWLRPLIPYDRRKYNRMISLSPHIDVIGSEGSLNHYSDSERATLIESSIDSQRRLYENWHYHLISMAATRCFGPTSPFASVDETEIEGIICTSPVILMFQIAAIAEHVSSDLQFWVSDKNVDLDELRSLLNLNLSTHREYYESMRLSRTQELVEGHKKYTHSALRLLATPLEKINFDTIPIGTRVDPMSCPVSTLLYSMLDDHSNFSKIGELTVPQFEHASEIRANFEKNIPKLKEEARKYRENFCRSLNS